MTPTISPAHSDPSPTSAVMSDGDRVGHDHGDGHQIPPRVARPEGEPKVSWERPGFGFPTRPLYVAKPRE